MSKTQTIISVIFAAVVAWVIFIICIKRSNYSENYGVYYQNNNTYTVYKYDEFKFTNTNRGYGPDDALNNLNKYPNMGIKFNSWRNSNSCGYEDSLQNLIVIPIIDSKLIYKGHTFIKKNQENIFKIIDSNYYDNYVIIDDYKGSELFRRYLYDRKYGVRAVYVYNNGRISPDLILVQGSGILRYCNDFSWGAFINIKNWTALKTL